MNALEQLTDEDLAGLLHRRDESAFMEIYNRHWKLLYTSVYAVLRDSEQSKDIVQEVFVSIWTNADKQPITHLKAYLQQACRFQVYKQLQRKKNDASFYDRLSKATSDIITENGALEKEYHLQVRKVIASLPDIYRETFLLSREDNLTYKQIAERLHISEKAVEKRMSKSLQFLRETIGLSPFMMAMLISFDWCGW
jgi:RNA polymerase sigma-70 factor (ECF subfamily)